MGHYHHSNRAARLRAGRWSSIPVAQDGKQERSTGRVRQERRRGPRGPRRRERSRDDEGLDASRRWQNDFHHSAGRVHPRLRDEPPHPSPRAAGSLFPPARRSCPWSIRTLCGRSHARFHWGRGKLRPFWGRADFPPPFARFVSQPPRPYPCIMGIRTPRRRTLETPVILSAVRTPIGKFQGGLAGFSAPELGGKIVAEAIRRAGIESKQVDEAILGNVVQAGLGQNPARQAAPKGGCQPRVAAMTINKVCGSGLKAVALAAQAVQLGESEIVAAGGMESMSNCPYLLPQARTGYRLGDGKLIDSMIHDGLWDAYENFHMGMTGELVAEKYGITREEQDRFAVESHQKAVRARKSCFFEAQILPIEVPQKKGDPIVIKYDESPREDSSMEALGKLKPAFKKDGTVTAGNAPGTNDGAAALIVTSERNASR